VAAQDEKKLDHMNFREVAGEMDYDKLTR
jgi:hypothetical protein